MKKLLGLSLALALTACSHVNVESMECKVTGKDSITKDGSHHYRLYTTCGTLVVEDQLTRLNFSSADLYGSIETGKTYRFTVGGVRVPVLSKFPSVIEVKRL